MSEWQGSGRQEVLSVSEVGETPESLLKNVFLSTLNTLRTFLQDLYQKFLITLLGSSGEELIQKSAELFCNFTNKYPETTKKSLEKVLWNFPKLYPPFFRFPQISSSSSLCLFFQWITIPSPGTKPFPGMLKSIATMITYLNWFQPTKLRSRNRSFL